MPRASRGRRVDEELRQRILETKPRAGNLVSRKREKSHEAEGRTRGFALGRLGA